MNDVNSASIAGRVALLPGDGGVIIAYDDVLLGVTDMHIATDLPAFMAVVDHYFKIKKNGVSGTSEGHVSSLLTPEAAAFAAFGASQVVPELQSTPAIRAWVRSMPFMTP
jgi:hypothetical protein